MSVNPTPPECDEDFDIYGDLLPAQPASQLGESPEKLQHDNEILKKQVSSFQSELRSLQKKVLVSNKTIKNLQCNISVLFNTATAEVKRKDATIAELRRELDNVVFRRNKKTSANKKETAATNSQEPAGKNKQSGAESRKGIRKNNIGAKENGKNSPELESSMELLADVTVSESEVTRQLSPNRCQVGEIRQAKTDQIEQSDIDFNSLHLSSQIKDVTGPSENAVSDHPNGRRKKTENNDKEKPSVFSRLQFPIKKGDEHPEAFERDGDVQHSEKKGSVWSRLGTRGLLNTKTSNTEKRSGESSPDSNKENSNHDDERCDSKEEFSEKAKKVKETAPNNCGTKTTHYEGSNNSPQLKGGSDARAPKSDAVESKSDGVEPKSDSVASKSHTVKPKHSALGGKVKHKSSALKPKSVAVEPKSNIVKPKSSTLDPKSDVSKPIKYDQKSVLDSEHMPEKTDFTPLSKRSCAGEVHEEQLKEPLCGEPLQNQHQAESMLPTAANLVSPTYPPLPTDEPAPLPPLPIGSPPGTPSSKDPKKLSDSCTAASLPTVTELCGSITKTYRSLTSRKTSAESSGNASLGVAVNPRVSESKEKGGVEDLYNPPLQCPFKPRCRAKSVKLVYTLSDNNPSSSSRTKEKTPPREKTPGKERNPVSLNSSSSRKKSLRKEENTDYRHFSDSRSTPRPSHNSRHLSSVKWSAHTPERRSPSEVLNKKSCRIERASHQDEIRIRIPDRRSRSLSPIRRGDRHERRRREDYYSRPRDSRSRINSSGGGREDNSKRSVSARRIDYKNFYEMSSTAREKRQTRSETKLKSAVIKIGPEEKSGKTVNAHSCTNLANGKIDHSIELEGKVREMCSQPTQSSSKAYLHSDNMKQGSSETTKSENDVNRAPILTLKRRSRSSIRLEDSEAASDCEIVNRQGKNDTQRLEKSPAFGSGDSSKNHPMTTISHEHFQEPPQTRHCSDDASLVTNTKDITDSEVKKSNPNFSAKIGDTPLYFREQANKSDSRSGDEDFFSESEESSSGGSDVSYKPKSSKKRSRKKETTQNCKRRAIQK